MSQMDQCIPLHLLLSTARAAQHPVAVRGQQVFNFSQFSLECARWRAAFAAQAGTRFVLYFNDTFSFSAALFGAWHAGKCVYLPADILPATLAALGREVDGFAGDIALPDLIEASAASDAVLKMHEWQALVPSAIGLVVYTSGSTGEPSAIPKRLSQMFEEVASLASCFDTQLGAATVLATVSHQHIYGLLFRVLWPLASGRIFATSRLAFSEDIASALRLCESSILVSSPAHLKRLSVDLDWASGTRGLKSIFCSGGPLSDQALADCCNILGQAPLEVYGSSETGGVAWRQRKDASALAWQALPGVAIRIADENLQVCSAHLFDPGWLATADRVRMSGERFELIGRVDRIIKIEEKRVSLTAIEAALISTGLLSEVRIVPLPGTRLTLGVVAVPSMQGWVLHDTSGKMALNEALRAALSSAVESSVMPRRWRYRWALPHNAQSKTTEAALLALFDPRRPEARLLTHTGDSAQFRIEVADKLPYFDGHFKNFPILAGVTQIEWAILLGRELFELAPQFMHMDGVKFQHVITVGHSLLLELAIKHNVASPTPIGDSAAGVGALNTTLSFKFSSDAGQHSSGRILFGPALAKAA
ncbi:MAG: AMP-binding protein [Pseudomonadota bacterium]